MADDQDAPIDWDERAQGWDEQPETHVYAQEAFSLLGPLVAEHLGPWAGLSVLDFGAGTGLLTEKLAPLCAEVVAIDPAAAMIRVLDAKLAAAAHENVTTVAALLTQELCEEHAELQRPFDLVVASSVCSFLPDFGEQLTLLAKLLRPGGLFVHWDWHADAGDEGHGFTIAEVESAYEAASLELVSCDVGFLFTFGDDSYEVLMGAARK